MAWSRPPLCTEREGSSGRCFSLAGLTSLSCRPVIPPSTLQLCQGNLLICSSLRSATGPFGIYRSISVPGPGLPLLSSRRLGEQGPEAGRMRRSQQGAERSPSGHVLWENTEVACHMSNPEVHKTRALLDSRGRFVTFHGFFSHSQFCFLLYFLEKLLMSNSNFGFLVKI